MNYIEESKIIIKGLSNNSLINYVRLFDDVMEMRHTHYIRNKIYLLIHREIRSRKLIIDYSK